MNGHFKFEQGNNGQIQYARLTIPGCGRKEKDDAPTVLVEIENGVITLSVYGDIQSSEATHEIPLNGALLEKKARNTEPATGLLIQSSTWGPNQRKNG